MEKTVALQQEIYKTTQEDIEKIFWEFSDTNEAAVGVVNLYGIPIHGFSSIDRQPFIEVEVAGGEVYKIYLRTFDNQPHLIEALKKGEEVTVTGYVLNRDKIQIYPKSIRIDDQVFNIKIDKILKRNNVDLHKELPELKISLQEWQGEVGSLVNREHLSQEVTIAGRVKDIYIPEEKLYGMAYREERLLREVSGITHTMPEVYDIFKARRPMVYESTDYFTGVNNLMCILPIAMTGEPMLLVSMISLQQVEETIDTINYYFAILFLIAMGISILVAYIYSKRITRPLLHLNQVAESLAELDFSRTCRVETEDEIGNLANNINTMAYKLKDTLDTLKKDIAYKEKMERERKQLMGDISHELKTPLTVIKGISEGLMDGVYHGEDYYKIILKETNDMAEMVYEILELSRLDKEEMLKIEPLDLSEVLYKVHSILKELVRNRQYTVQFDIDEDVIVLADEKKIERVIRNFYTNAIKHSKEKAQIDIHIKKRTQQIIFSVENTGAKIPKEHIDKVWDAFYRIETSRNKESGGTGLGLYIASQILKKHGALYGVENTAHGVKVWFVLEKWKGRGEVEGG